MAAIHGPTYGLGKSLWPSPACMLGYRMIKKSALILATVLSVAPVSAAPLSKDEVRSGYLEHAALAQFHRWFQLYENREVPIENQLDILTEDVKLSSGLGEAKGHEAYKERVSKLPESWANAHFVKASTVEKSEAGGLLLEAEVRYLNQGMLPDGVIRAADLSYTAQLTIQDTGLPLFSSIKIEQNSNSEEKVFTDAYPENRLKSLVHQWLHLIENPQRDVEPFKEVLAEDFSLNFSQGPIPDFEAFTKWYEGPASSVAASTHSMSDFSFTSTGENSYGLQVTFDWQGILPDGSELAAKTRHSWNVIDDPKERFARIKDVQVEVLERFAPLQREKPDQDSEGE